jgi:hypothetical protein
METANERESAAGHLFIRVDSRSFAVSMLFRHAKRSLLAEHPGKAPLSER